MVQNYTPVMWDDKAFAFVPYEAFGDLPHYPKEKCEQICKELNSLIRLCTYRPKKEDIYFHPVSYVRRSGGFIVTDNQASFEKCPYPACADRHSCQKICDLMNRVLIIVFTCKKLLMTKKKLPVRFTGQHFTIDKVLIKDAIRQANISNQDTVLDIGAGKGFLTVHLLKIANNVVAIENDTALVEHLRKLFSDARNVQVVGCDFRNFAVPKFPFKVVSNIPYGITSDIFKILMFESLGNFLGGSIVLQLEPTQKLFSRKLYNPYTVFYHTFFDLKLVYEVGPESFLPPPTVKSALLNIKRKHLFFDFKFKAKYLAFISCLLEKPDLSVKTALKSIFRKSQVRSISEKFGLNLNAQIVCLSPSQWLNCFLEMLEVVPEKFHPS